MDYLVDFYFILLQLILNGKKLCWILSLLNKFTLIN